MMNLLLFCWVPLSRERHCKTRLLSYSLPSRSCYLNSTSMFPLPRRRSAKSRPGEPPQVPLVLHAGLRARLPASVRRSGPAGRTRRPPPAAWPAPAREAGARSRRRREEQEGPAESHRVHRAAADGPGEALREAEVPLHPGQVRPLLGFHPKPVGFSSDILVGIHLHVGELETDRERERENRPLIRPPHFQLEINQVQYFLLDLAINSGCCFTFPLFFQLVQIFFFAAVSSKN